MEDDDGGGSGGDPQETTTRRWARPQPLPKFVFGLTTGVSGNCLFVDDHVIVFPAAGVIVVHDLNSKAQRFIPLTGPRKVVVTAMALNTINHVLAVATVADGPEDDVESPVVSIYDLQTLGLKHVFIEPDGGRDAEDTSAPEVDAEQSDHSHRNRNRGRGRRRFVNVRFLYDNIFMAAFVVGGDDGSDCALYYYSWRNSKVETSLRIDGPVADVALNPIDTAICCFVGKELFRLMTRTEIDWTQYGFREAIGIDFTCVCWLDGDRCLAGTSDGRVIVLKNGTLQNSYHVNTIRDMDLTIKTEKDRLSVIAQSSEDGRQPEAVRICFTFQYGLVLVVGDSDVYYFRKTDDGMRYVRNRVYQKREYWYFQAVKGEDEVPLHRVESACVSPNHEKLTCLTRCGQLYWAPLDIVGRSDVRDQDESLNSAVVIDQLLGNDFHYGGVESLSTCLWRPLLMTCGKFDCAIKMWDYTECVLLFTKQYSHKVCCVSLHPTGLYSVAVFLDHVEFQMVQTEDLVPMKYFPILGCSAVVFSGSGHMFALAKQDQIDVYSSLMFDKCFSCHGHLGIIDTLVWCNHDKNIVAYDKVGAICMFDTRTGKGMMHIAPYSGAAYTGLAVAEDVNRMFVITKDGVLKEVYDRKVVRELNFHQGSLNAVTISKSDSTLFVATENGVLIGVLLPMIIAVVQKEFNTFNKSIMKMCLTADGSTLVTCLDDGSICIWEIKDNAKDVKEDIQIDIRSAHYDDVLVNFTELEKLNEKIAKTELAVRNLESEISYTNGDWKKSKEQDVKSKEMSILNFNDFVEKSNKVTAVMHRADVGKLQNELVALRTKNEQAVATMDAMYSDRLVKKYVKYLQLEHQVTALAEELKKSLDAVQERLNEELQRAIDNYEENLKQKDEEILESKNKLNSTKKCLQTLVGDTEDDVDGYIYNVRRELTAKLLTMKKLYLNSTVDEVKYKMDYESFEKKITGLRQTADILKCDINVLEASAVKKNSRIVDLSNTLARCKDDIKQRDEEILEVKNHMVRLNSQQLTLKESIEELEKAIQPLLLNIEKKRNEIQERESKIDRREKQIKNFELFLVDLKESKDKAKRSMDDKSKTLHEILAVIKQMKIDLHAISKHYPTVNESRRKIQEFYDKYVGERADNKIEEEEFEARIEFHRQRQYMERKIESLKQTIESPKELHYMLLEENIQRLKELEVLRKEAKMYLSRYEKLKYFLPSHLKSNKKKTTLNIKKPSD